MAYTTEQASKERAMNDILDEQEFYELMQVYRHAPTVDQDAVVLAFESVKEFIRDNVDAIGGER
jgi:hypothetical protein